MLKMQNLAVSELENYCSRQFPGDRNRFPRLLLLLSPLRAFHADMLEDIFFSGLIGNIQIDTIISYILKMEPKEYQNHLVETGISLHASVPSTSTPATSPSVSPRSLKEINTEVLNEDIFEDDIGLSNKRKDITPSLNQLEAEMDKTTVTSGPKENILTCSIQFSSPNERNGQQTMFYQHINYFPITTASSETGYSQQVYVIHLTNSAMKPVLDIFLPSIQVEFPSPETVQPSSNLSRNNNSPNMEKPSQLSYVNFQHIMMLDNEPSTLPSYPPSSVIVSPESMTEPPQSSSTPVPTRLASPAAINFNGQRPITVDTVEVLEPALACDNDASNDLLETPEFKALMQ